MFPGLPKTTTRYGLFQIGSTISTRSYIVGRLKPFAQKKPVEQDREKRASRSKKIVEFVRNAINNEEPSFKQGAKPIYFPGATICLLRPNAKHTPYQAKFIVPKSFNKLDLRDYLWNIYHLRVLNITSTLSPASFTRSLPAPYRTRFRSPQVKKMTVDLIDPFVWPAETEDFREEKELGEEMEKYRTEKEANLKGANKEKPSTAFGGIIDPEPRSMNFISKRVKKQMRNIKRRDIAHRKLLDAGKFIEQYVPLQ
mgnify:CR=1 FL=1